MRRRILAPLLTVLLVLGVGYLIYVSVMEQRSVRINAAAAPEDPVAIRIMAAPAVEPWLRSVAATYNTEDHRVANHPIQVEIIPIDGLRAITKWERGDFDPIPTAWVAESRDWVNQANEAALDRMGQDIFLASGEYRMQPLVLSPLVWGIWEDAYTTLADHFETTAISWDEIHAAAVAERWAELGGEADAGPFKLVIAHPKHDPAGLTAMVSAAGEYYDKPTADSAELLDTAFLEWLSTSLDTVVDFSPFGAENMLLFGRSNGDAGLIVESYLLTNMEGLVTKWDQPLTILYPDPIAWFDFPYAIYMGTETSPLEKEAALAFKEHLLTANQQALALDFGLRPACAECPMDSGLLAQWEELGVRVQVPSASRMRSASRSGLDGLQQWFIENYEE